MVVDVLNRPARRCLAGLAAGAAGTTALNAATYLDMAIRGRPASRTPEDTVAAVAKRAGLDVPGDAEARRHRLFGLGALGGLLVGTGVGGVVGLGWGVLPERLPLAGAVVAGVAMGAANGPMAALAVTDPGRWSAADWLADVVPHLAYGYVTAAVLRALQPG